MYMIYKNAVYNSYIKSAMVFAIRVLVNMASSNKSTKKLFMIKGMV